MKPLGAPSPAVHMKTQNKRDLATGVAPRTIFALPAGLSSFDHPFARSERCRLGCRCNLMDDFRIYFTAPTIHNSSYNSPNKKSFISVATPWHLNYAKKLKKRLKEEAGLQTISDPHINCNWYSVLDASRAAVQRGVVEVNQPDLNTSTLDFDQELQRRINEVLMTTYPVLEITLICGFTLGIIGVILLGLLACCSILPMGKCFKVLSTCKLPHRSKMAHNFRTRDVGHESGVKLQNEIGQTSNVAPQNDGQNGYGYSYPYVYGSSLGDELPSHPPPVYASRDDGTVKYWGGTVSE